MSAVCAALGCFEVEVVATERLDGLLVDRMLEAGEHRERAVEQANTQIRLIMRRGFGYHSPSAVIGAVEALVDLLDPRELELLTLGEVAGVLPQREPDRSQGPSPSVPARS